MNACIEESGLTPSERQLASEHWAALMFAPSRYALETARLALMQAPFSVQHAVIADINTNWLENYEPAKEENPFLDYDIGHTTIEIEETEPSPQVEVEEDVPSPPQVESVEATLTQTHTLMYYALRAEQWLKQPVSLNGLVVSLGTQALFHRVAR